MVVKLLLKFQPLYLSNEEGRKGKGQKEADLPDESAPFKDLSGTPTQMTTAYISLVTSICKGI